MGTNKPPVIPNCPACGRPVVHDHDDWFDCPYCHGHFSVKGYSYKLGVYQQSLEEQQLNLATLRKQYNLEIGK